MTKQSVNEDIKKLYIFNEPLDEKDVGTNHPELYQKSLEEYGEWEKALRANGINKRKIKERQRFMLYALLKNRYSDYGPEALRPKNIDKDTKNKIIESYKTLKLLKETIINWSPEKILYELRIQLLGGASLETLQKDNPVLYERLIEFYGDMSKVIEVYNNCFGSPTIEISKRKSQQTIPHDMDSIELERLAKSMVKMNYIDKPEDLYNIQEAQKKEEKEIYQFVSQLIVEAQVKGESLSMQTIYKKNPTMFFAIKLNYGDLNTAISEMTKSVVVNG